MRTIELIFATQFVDEAEVRRQIAESRPRIERHLGLARLYEARTPDIRAIHRAYIQAWDGLLAGYAAIETGFDTGEFDNLARGRRKLEDWQAAILDTARRLGELAERTDATPGQPTRQNGASETQTALARHRARAVLERSGDVLLSHMATMQYHRRWRA